MSEIEKILIAVDGSNSAIYAAIYAFQLAKKLNAEIEIIYVVRYALGNIDAGILPYEIEAKEKEKAIKLIHKMKVDYPDLKINDLEIIGRPVSEINKIIQNWNADLLVIGHHTHHFINQLLQNSTENNLLKNLQVPLLVIPENFSFTKG